MAFAEQLGRGNGYNLRAHRAQPGSMRDDFQSDNDVDFTINSEPAVASCDTNGVDKRVEGDDGNWYTVDAIKDHMTAPNTKGTTLYCVKWEGCGELTWEPEKNLRWDTQTAKHKMWY
ncbi:chromatin organization modifier (chromo) domain protein [Metarhizium robertsii]|uniref:Chromatin organization modifier (Chromo) domain protein n=1 Tax=Metarhizium robertsii TaxID=568076 RepID=A0A014QR17_9HYPO|nr:chromatin organization modifier (chromo) domain protein [Metarhizium robertsii]